MTAPAHPVAVDAVRRLLAAQHPDLAELPIRHANRGWDNDLFRVGTDLAVRIPHRLEAVPLLDTELTWLPVLAPRLPLPVAVPLRRGEPDAGFPWPWAVVPWLPGRSALLEPPDSPHAAAEALGRFFRALHQPAPMDAPVNPYRGVPLDQRLPLLDQALVTVDRRGDLPVPTGSVRRLVDQCAGAPGWKGPPVWIHGDPHAHNLLVHDGRISAVVDFGDLAGGDPASDIGELHSLLPARALPGFCDAYGVAPDDALWVRAAGWAVCVGLAILAGPDDTIRPMGRRLMNRGIKQAQHLS